MLIVETRSPNKYLSVESLFVERPSKVVKEISFFMPKADPYENLPLENEITLHSNYGERAKNLVLHLLTDINESLRFYIIFVSPCLCNFVAIFINNE